MTPAARKTIGLAIPTLNAGAHLPRLLPALAQQSLQPDRFLVLDSQSDDDTVAQFREAGAEVVPVIRSEFDHGRTRQRAVEILMDCEILIFLTQDAIPANPDAFANIASAFDNPAVGVAYGRQQPAVDATPISSHARIFNYPVQSTVVDLEAARSQGIRGVFSSNSFAAYRRAALGDVGGFPSDMIVSEDVVAAAAIILQGWKKCYVAQSAVYHSHNYTVWQEFTRYFDIGVAHNRTPWLLDAFGKTGSEGTKFVRSEIAYLWENAPSLIPTAILRTATKLAAYRLGRAESNLPMWIKPRLSMHRGYWRKG